MSKLNIGQVVTLKIHGLGLNGEGIAAYENFTVYVDGALPGELVKVSVFTSQKTYAKAHLLEVIEASPDRVAPICKLFGKCGGCQIMHLSYQKQLEAKRQRVIKALEKIGKISNCEVAPCLASPLPLHYRNKIQLPVRKGLEGISLGLYAKASNELVDVETCYTHCALGEEVYQKIREVVKGFDIEPYDPITGSGELRHILIKSAVYTKEALVTLVTSKEPSMRLKDLAKEIISCYPAIKGVVHNLHEGKDNVVLGRKYAVLEGSGFIQEKLCGLYFKVSPASFFQVNPNQAENLYEKALEFAGVTGTETVLDAYCGVGTLSLIFAKSAKQVIGVECVPEAIEDAKFNAKHNNIENASFTCANAEDFISTLSNIDVALINPPRKGCERTFLEGITTLRPQSIVYISCEPETLARDLAYLQQSGYKIEAIQPFDMFPQTAHVECVAQLRLTKK